MFTLKKISFFVALVAVLLMASSSFADTIIDCADGFCDPANVTLDTIRLTPYYNLDGSVNLDGDANNPDWLSTSYDATSCVGMFIKDVIPDGADANNNNGNEDPNSGTDEPGDTPSANIGEFGDGLLNGQGYPYYAPDPEDPATLIPYFTGEEFVDKSMWQDLDGDGEFGDPGWIHLANIQVSDDGTAAESTTYDTSGPHPYKTIMDPDDPANELVINIGDLLEIDFNFSTERWTLTTLPDIIEKAQLLLGENSFDHLAFSFKSSDAFAVYDFDFNEIFGLEDNLDLFNFHTPYQLSGEFYAGDFCDKDWSHINVYARDPINTVIPEPGTIVLLGMGFLGLGYAGYRRKNK